MILLPFFKRQLSVSFVAAPLHGVCWALGCIVGYVKNYIVFPLPFLTSSTSSPLIGGTFANPAANFPDTLGRIDFLQRHVSPVLLSLGQCIHASTVYILAVFLALFHLHGCDAHFGDVWVLPLR